MSANKRPVVVTVHGTFAGVVNEALPHWWQLNGQLATDLKARFPPDEIDVQTFPWKDDETTGPNRESERQRAGRLLFEHVLKFEDAGTPYHLVGHSHGGSVIWHALKYSAARNQRLKYLKSWTSISTPFLELGSDGSVWRRVAAAVAVAVALYWMGIWELAPKIMSAVRLSGPAGLMTSIPLIEDLPDIRTALGDLSFFALIGTFGVIALLFAFWLALPFGDLIRYSVKGPKLQRSELKATEWYEPLWLGLAHPQDEAIAGLKATLIRAPDLVIRRRRGLFGLVLGLFKPAARATDQFAWSTLIRNAQGCDVYGADIRRVAAAPEPFKNDVTPLPPAVVAEIEAQADIAAAGVLARFRDRLQALSDQADIAALSGVLAGTYDDDSLIHTSMFDNVSVRAAIVDWIAAPGAAPSRAPVRNVVARFGKRTVALSVAKAMIAVGIVAVVTLIAGQEYQVYYAESRLAAAERIIARFDEPAFKTLSDGAIGGEALVRAVRLGSSIERAFAAAAKLRDDNSKSEAFQILMREFALKNGADELQRWLLSQPVQGKPVEPHRMADQLARSLPVALNALARTSHPPSAAAASGLIEIARIQINAGLKGSERNLERIRAYEKLVATALALGQPKLAVALADIVFEGQSECGNRDRMIDDAAAAVTDQAGAQALEQIIRNCKAKTGAEDTHRMMRRKAVGKLQSCEFAKPLLEQASVNRIAIDALVPPLFLECLGLGDRRDDAARLSASYRSFLARISPTLIAGGKRADLYWSLAQALIKAGMTAEADEWVKMALKELDDSAEERNRRGAEAQFAADATTLEILRATNKERHAAFLKKISTEGDEFNNSRQFPASKARLRQMYAEYFERSRDKSCAVANDDLTIFASIVGILQFHDDKNPSSVVIPMLSVADRCKFTFSESLLKGMSDIVLMNNNIERRAVALAQLAAFQPTLRMGLAGAETAGLPAAILKGYVIAIDRHRPSARDSPTGGAAGWLSKLVSN